MIERLCEFVAVKNYYDLPEAVVEGAKNRLLDFLGCALAGHEEKSTDIVFGFIQDCANGQECTIIGDGKTAMQYAALVNGILGHSKELDDEHKLSMTHLGVAVIPAALALGEKKGVDGKELITSIVMGYEVGARIGMAVCGENLLTRGFHPTGVIGVFGATAAASKILGLDRDTTMSAIGIAGSLASGLFEFVSDGSWTKRLHPGWASHNGIIAALLASKGFTGPHSVIEGKFGFANAFSNCLKAEEISNNLGESFQILEATFKPHACCSFIHPLIDAALEIAGREPIDFKTIKSIRCKIFSAAIPIVVEPWEKEKRVNNSVDAQFNAFYSVAWSIYKKSPILPGFSTMDLHDPAIIELSKKIKIVKEESFDKQYPKHFPAEVRVSLTNGNELVKEVHTNKGSPSWPMSLEEIQSKFKLLCSRRLSPKRVHEIIQRVESLSSMGKVEDLCYLLRMPNQKD